MNFTTMARHATGAGATACPRRAGARLIEPDQWWVRWGIQSRHYNAGSTHKLFYEGESLLPLGGAVTQVASGASASSAMYQGTLTPGYQAMLSTAYAAGTVHQQHIGDFAVMARLYRPTSNAGTVTVALEWGEGDFRKRTVNPAVIYDVDDREGDWTLADLGQVHLSQAAQGNQRWEGRLLAKSSTTGDDIYCDCLMLFPVTEGSGIVSAVAQFENPTSFTARDEFDQSSGNLSGKTLPVGGTWSGAGDADDFTVETTGHTAQRTATSDSPTIYAGRFALAGSSTYALSAAQIDFKPGAGGDPFLASWLCGAVLRYVSGSNYWLMGAAFVYGSNGPIMWGVYKNAPGGVTLLASTTRTAPQADWATVRLLADAGGRWWLWGFPRGASPGAPVLSGYHADLATGGALASGKLGFYDGYTAATAFTRNFDNFVAFTPTLDAAMFASQSLEIRHDRVIREDSSGSYWTKPSSYEGDYLLIPPAGREGRTTRIIVKASRNDPDTMADPAIDDISAQLTYIPRYLVVPEA